MLKLDIYLLNLRFGYGYNQAILIQNCKNPKSPVWFLKDEDYFDELLEEIKPKELKVEKNYELIFLAVLYQEGGIIYPKEFFTRALEDLILFFETSEVRVKEEYSSKPAFKKISSSFPNREL